MSRNIRRSKRNKEKNKVIAEQILSSQAFDSEIQELHAKLLTKQKSYTKLRETKPLLSASCKGCKSEEPPVKRYENIFWIQCKTCDDWWHIECACLRKEDSDKFYRHNINFNCAYCVLDLLPKTSTPASTKIQCIASNKPDTPKELALPIFIDDSEHSESDADISDQSSSPQPCQQYHVIIVDNIENPKELRSSVLIAEKLKRFEQFSETEFVYSLPQGGIALHFKSEEAANKALQNWPDVVFNVGEVPHRPSDNKENKVNFMKNVDTSLSETQIGKILEERGIRYSNIKRLHYRYSKNRMPVVKLVHPSAEDKKAAQKVNIPISFQRRNAFLESQKIAVTRCYNCQRFGHISKICVYGQRCENCGQSDHLGEVCGAEVFKCANCSGTHKSSAKICPVFIQHASKRRNSAICKP